jgi:outer membrane protein assembly factor BamB/tetratricopeptide (TPR) repeat protein
MCLEQLEKHPDRVAGKGADAAKLALSLSRYLPRPEVRAWAERWAADAKLDPALVAATTPIEPPPAAKLAPLTPLDAGASGGLERLGHDPLITAGLNPVTGDELEALAVGDARLRDDDAWVFPTILGEVAYVNNGVDVAALDRFTLAQLWRTRPPDPVFGPDISDLSDAVFTRGRSQVMEDVQTVTVAQGVAIAATGLAVGGRRDGDRRVHAMRASNGELLWSCDIAALAPILESTSVRGPAIVSGDTAVLSLRKRAPQRRVSSVFLAGVGLFDGNLRWVRLVGTAGIFPAGRGDRTVDCSVLDRGIIYRSDELGVIAAVEAATGRPVWVRRYDADSGWNSAPQRSLFAAARPVAADGALYTVRPGGEEVLQLELATGKLLGSRPTNTFGEPRYVVRVGDYLAGVGTERVGFVRLTEFKGGDSRVTEVLRRPSISGRAVAVGSQLVVPTEEGLLVLDPSEPAEGRTIPLATTGAAIIEGEYLLTADATNLSAYMPWESVDAVLRGRMERTPGDARPALALIELASRAGKTDQILAAADRALAVFDAAPAEAGSREGRRRLFELLLGIIERALGEPGQTQNLASIGDIAARLPATVDSAQERAAALLIRGRLDEQQGDHAHAVESYQQILADPALSAAPVLRLAKSPSPGTAGRQASERVREAVVHAGFDAYRPFDDEAARALADAGPTASLEALERIAQRYPAAGAAIDAWSESARRLLDQKHADKAIGALQRALATADTMVAAGRVDVLPRCADLTSRVVTLLLQADRPSAAARLLSSSHASVTGDKAASEAVRAQIHTALAAQKREPRLGRHVGPGLQTIEGWVSPEPAGVRPLSPAVGRPVDHILLEDPRGRRVGLWVLSPDGASLELAWTRPYDNGPPRLLRTDGRDTILFWRSTTGGRVERISNLGETGDWKTEDLGVWFGPTTAEERRGRLANDPVQINTPQDGSTKNEDLVIAADASFAAIARRGGKVGLLDLQSGAGRWVQLTPLDTVFDVAVADGLVAVSGIFSTGNPAPGDPRAASESRIIFYDALTGDEKHRFSSATKWGNSGLEGALRWMRLLEGSQLLIGTDDGIALLDARTGASKWANPAAPARDTTEAWVLPGRAVVLDRAASFLIFRMSDGQQTSPELDGRGRFERPHDIAIHEAGAGVAISAPRGVAIFDSDGILVGADALGGAKELLPAVAAGGMLVTIDAEVEPVPRLVPAADADSSLDAAEIRIFEIPSGRLIESRKLAMGDDPRRLFVLDGKVVVCTNVLTLVVDAPASDK